MADNRPQMFRGPDVAIGSIPTEMGCPRDVRFPPESDRIADMAGGPFRAPRPDPDFRAA
jgi:hypothetical protein